MYYYCSSTIIVIARALSLAVGDFVLRMSVNKLKCTSCNLVISEVLAFLRDRHHVIDNESLIKICETAFSEEEIDEAKKLLYISTKTAKKLVSRRKNKKQKDLEDMITVFKTIDPEQLPVFVAYDLHKLPPVCFDHVDVTKLLKDILVLRKEIGDIKSDYVTNVQLEELKLKVNLEKSSPLINSNSNVNMKKRGGYMINCDSGPFGLLPHIEQQPLNDVDVPCSSRKNTSHDSASETPSVPIYRSLVHMRTGSETQNKPVSLAPVNSTMLENDSLVTVNDICKQQTMAEIVKKGEWKENKPEEQWILVQRSKTRNRFVGMTGKAASDPVGNFKAADIKVPVFISNVNKGTTEKDICEYIQQKTSEVVKLEKIVMKSERQYNAFKLFIPKRKLATFLDDELWPEGIMFRRFIHFKKGIVTDIVNNNPVINNG